MASNRGSASREHEPSDDRRRSQRRSRHRERRPVAEAGGHGARRKRTHADKEIVEGPQYPDRRAVLAIRRLT